MTKVSAIVSAYFAEQYIDGRLQNLMNQQPAPEIVVVCREGSAEHELVQSEYEGFECIKLVLTQDIPTVYEAWNKGIEAATGEYITNANSDDRLYPGALASLADALDKHPKYAAAYADVDIVDEIGAPPVGRYEWMEGGMLELLSGCFLGPMPMWRKSLHEKYGLFDGEMHSAGDYEFWMRIAKGGEKFFHVRETLGAYLNRPDSAEHRQKLRSLWEQARAKGRYREGVGKWITPEPMTE